MMENAVFLLETTSKLFQFFNEREKEALNE